MHSRSSWKEREQKELAHKFFSRLPGNKTATQEVRDARRSLDNFVHDRRPDPFHDGNPDLAASGFISAAEFRGQNCDVIVWYFSSENSDAENFISGALRRHSVVLRCHAQL